MRVGRDDGCWGNEVPGGPPRLGEHAAAGSADLDKCRICPNAGNFEMERAVRCANPVVVHGRSR